MTLCHLQGSGTIELYFYGELSGADRDRVEQHVQQCADCRTALEELALIRDALAGMPVVSAPPAGDWTAFMDRLDTAVTPSSIGSFPTRVAAVVSRPRRWMGYVAMAALLTIVTIGVLLASQWRRMVEVQAPGLLVQAGPAPGAPRTRAAAVEAAATDANASFVALSEDHLERSKLVVLGIANKDARQVEGRDWTYERQLASSLLSDTRLYRMTAEDRGVESVARVMRDLELVLLQASLTEDTKPAALEQIQRLIQKRDLVARMNVVNTRGL
jgi:anti-sigma factor RsiW